MAHRRRDPCEDRDARSSIWAGSISSDAGYVGADWNGSIEEISLQTGRAIRFERLLGGEVGLRMLRPRHQPAQAERPELLAHAALVHRHAELSLDAPLEIDPPPAHHAVALGIGTGLHPCRELRLLLRGEAGPAAG